MEDHAMPSLIACGIFREEVVHLIEQDALEVKPYFLNPGLHNDPPSLEKALRGLLTKLTQRNAGNVIVLYGEICLGFQNEMAGLVDEFDVVRVNALNCIDCYLGGRSRLLEIDPEHEYFFLNPSWIELEFGGRDLDCPTAASRREFNMLKGLYLLDTLDNLVQYEARIQKKQPICQSAGRGPGKHRAKSAESGPGSRSGKTSSLPGEDYKKIWE